MGRSTACNLAEFFTFLAANPTTLDEPTWVHNRAERAALLSGNVSVNLLYAQAAAFSPNPDAPPYYVDVPHLPAALKENGVDYTFVESPGDHLAHLNERTAVALQFLSNPARLAPGKQE